MNDETYKGIGVAAGLMMLKWDLLNTHMGLSRMKIEPGDEVNVFINFESVLRNLVNMRNISAKVSMFKQQMVIELVSSVLNLVATYRAYFKRYNPNVKVFLYYTDLLSETPQQMTVYNKYYREYYKNRYTNNPDFKAFGEVLSSIIIPEVKLILNYVPNCYMLSSDSFDSSIIPSIVSGIIPARNIIITEDIFDTLYMFNPEFMTIYIKRRYQYFHVTSDIESTVRSIIKDESMPDISIFNGELYYRLLLAIKGSKIRNIKSTKGYGYTKFTKLLNNGLKDGIILRDFNSLNSVIGLFPKQFQEDIANAFKCTSLDNQIDLLSETDISQIKNQIVDRVDIKSIEELNNKRFFDYPINMAALIY